MFEGEKQVSKHLVELFSRDERCVDQPSITDEVRYPLPLVFRGFGFL